MFSARWEQESLVSLWKAKFSLAQSRSRPRLGSVVAAICQLAMHQGGRHGSLPPRGQKREEDLTCRVGEVRLLFLKTKLSLGQRVGLKPTGQPLDQCTERDLAQGEHSHVASTQTKTQHGAEDTGIGL